MYSLTELLWPSRKASCHGSHIRRDPRSASGRVAGPGDVAPITRCRASIQAHQEKTSLCRPATVTFRLMHKFAASSRITASLAGLGCAIVMVSTGNAAPRVDFNAANDYYAALTSGRIRVVEQYHLAPCEQRLRALDFPKALAECNFILKIFPNHPKALFLMIQTCAQWKSSRCNAEDFLDKAVAINPRASATFVLQGIYFHGAHQYPKAVESFKTALELDPNSMNAHYNLALTFLETQQFDLANVHAQRAYGLGATLPGLRNRLTKGGYWKPIEQGAVAPPATKPAASDASTVSNTTGAK